MSVFESPDHMAFSSADDANVPVDIWLHAPDEERDKWQLTASNYMPRKGRLHPHGYSQTADSREELVALLTAHVLPLYRIAVAKIEGIVAGTEDHIYYWNDKPTISESEEAKL